MAKSRPSKRLVFTPSAAAREYFAQLCQRLTQEWGLGVRATHRETFERLVELARGGESQRGKHFT